VGKIYINGKFFGQRVTGTQRYARELLNQFDRLLSEGKYRNIAIEILVPRATGPLPPYANLKIQAVGRMRGTKWEQMELPQYCRNQLLFTLSGGAPVFHSRNVVTLHDAAVVAAPAGYSLPYRWWHGAVCRRMAHQAEHVFTNSKFSKSEIVKWYGAQPETVSVTYLGSDHFSQLEPDPSVLSTLGISGKYVLAVSSHNPNKNFDRVQVAMEQLAESGIDLVIAGAPDSRVYSDRLKFSEKVRVLGYVSDAQLKSLYENAACFVFASLYEGFGLPPVEALASGCPIVVSRAASLPELFEGIAFFCDPYDPANIAETIRRAIESGRSAVALKAFAKRFTWERCARKTLDVLKGL
jgi:glycosyltransferase involved in cell wall biosynthesis